MGYGRHHQDLRRAFAPQVATGTVRCARCRQLIEPGEEWHLGHVDGSRVRYAGPEHKLCNLKAAGRAASGRKIRIEPSRAW